MVSDTFDVLWNDIYDDDVAEDGGDDDSVLAEPKRARNQISF